MNTTDKMGAPREEGARMQFRIQRLDTLDDRFNSVNGESGLSVIELPPDEAGRTANTAPPLRDGLIAKAWARGKPAAGFMMVNGAPVLIVCKPGEGGEEWQAWRFDGPLVAAAESCNRARRRVEEGGAP